MISVTEFRRTCYACPSQWHGLTAYDGFMAYGMLIKATDGVLNLPARG